MASKSDLFARLALDYADHPKIAALSDAAFRAHIELILYARKYETDGIIRNPIANRLAFRWDTDVLTELQNNDNEAPSLIRLENGDYYLHGYGDMQETKAEIDARRRRNSSNGKRGGRPRNPGKTQSVYESDTQSAPQSQTQSGTQTKAETETETETDSNSAPKPPKPQKKSETSIPDGWEPTDAHKTKAHEKGVDLHQQAEAFRLHAETHDRRCVNWNSAFSMWLTKARPDTGPKQYQNAAEKKVEVARHWLSQPAQAPTDPWALPANTRKEIEQ